jgi:hypothetical protein
MNLLQRKTLRILAADLERIANFRSNSSIHNAIRDRLETISYLLGSFRAEPEWFEVASVIEVYRFTTPVPSREKLIALSDMIRNLAPEE